VISEFVDGGDGGDGGSDGDGDGFGRRRWVISGGKVNVEEKLW